MDFSPLICLIVFFLVFIFGYKLIKAVPKSMIFGIVLMFIGFFWTASALIFSSTTIDDVANLEKLFSRLDYVLVGCFITLIGSIFTVGSVFIKEKYFKKQPVSQDLT